MRKSYLEELIEKQRNITQECRNFTNSVLEEWKKELRFLNHEGQSTESLPEPDNQALILFKEAAKEEAKNAASKVLKLADPKKLIRKYNLTPSDCKAINRWRSNPPPKNISKYTGLPKRARRAIVETDKIVDKEVKSTLELYKLISPHTFCFVPPNKQIHPSLLEEFMSQYLLNTKNFRDDGHFIKSEPVIIHDEDNHKVDLMLYLSKDEPGLKLKFYSKHRENCKTADILDLEARFKGNEFLDIVHYHVTKPFTVKKILEKDSEIPCFFELSHVLESGTVRMRHRFARRKEEFKYTDEKATTDSIKAMQLWKKFPIVAGGSFFTIALNIIANNPKYESLQYHFTNGN
jgi:hypothetical protein